MDPRFAPRPGRFDTQLDLEASSQVGTGGLLLVANTTTRIAIPTPLTRSAIMTLIIQNGPVTGVDSDGTILATFNRRDNTGAADIPLNTAFDCEVAGLTSVNKTFNVPLLTTLTDANRTCLPGDTLYVNVVNNSAAIDTQPTGLFFMVEFALLQ